MSHRSSRPSLLSLALAAALSAGIAQTAEAITITADGSGQATPGDCTFACVLRYQQIYNHEIFTAPVEITRFEFQSSNESFWGAGALYVARFSVVPNGVNNLSTDLTANVGANEAQFQLRSFTGAVFPDDFFGFTGSYAYDPSQGDLLVDIQRVGGSAGGPKVYYNAGSAASDEYSRAYSFSDPTNGYAGVQYGNVTRFEVTPLPVDPVPNVPLPAALPMLVAGLASLRLLRRKPR